MSDEMRNEDLAALIIALVIIAGTLACVVAAAAWLATGG